jgi:tetratricopeptide (TPR) repeat protein/transcriptional regulator with XRE-family HTH domain
VTDKFVAFGARLDACRRSVGLSQQGLAERSGLSVRAISNLERGRIKWPHPDSVRRLADALELAGHAREEFFTAAGRRGVYLTATAVMGSDSEESLSSGGQSVPRQLPAPVRQFAGRQAEMAALTDLLDTGNRAPAAVVISVISGTAGVGKTALAVRWAHQVADRFPDGQLYVNLRGFDPSGRPMPPDEAIHGFLDALGVPAERIPASLDARAALFRSLLAGKRMLLVFDNARDAGQVRPLLPAGPGCLVVVVSRSQLAGLVAGEDARLLILDLLTEAEARELLALRLGEARVAAEPQATAELTRLCVRLPLALAIVAARACARPGFRIGVFAEELKDVRGRLDALETVDEPTSVRAVFSWSLSSLPAPATRMFALLGMHPGPDITVPAAASLAAMPLPVARRALGELADAQLITEHASARFAMHDLLQAYAAEQAASNDAEARRAAIRRMLDHYLHTVYTADRLLYPHRDALILPAPETDAPPESLTSARRALAWLRAERRVLLAVVAQAASLSFDDHAWQIACCLAMFLDLEGCWPESATAQQAALASAQRAGNTEAQARIHLVLSHVCMRLDAGHDAQAHLEHALRLYEQIRDRISQARVHVAFSLISNRQGRHHDAFAHAQQGLILYWSAGHQAGLAQALNAMGWSEAHLADPWRAVACCQKAVRLHQEAGHVVGECEGLDSLGYAYHQLGDLHQAISCYERSLVCHRQLASRHEEAVTRTRLGDAYLASGHAERARDLWTFALDVFETEHHPSADAVRSRIDYLSDEACHGTGEPISGSFFEPVY